MKQGSRPIAWVVDDGEPIRDLIAEMLLDAGFDVLEFQNAETALDATARGQPSLVLSDLRLGKGMSGAQLLRRIASSVNGVQCVLMSAAFDADLMPDFPFPLLAKPFSRADLHRLIRMEEI